jgi:hypothetical protein
MAVEPSELTQSSFGLDYWLRRCEGFLIDGPGGRIGRVGGVRFGSSAEPEVLEVRAGLFGRRTLLIAASEVAEVVPAERRLILSGSPRLLGSEAAEG